MDYSLSIVLCLMVIQVIWSVWLDLLDPARFENLVEHEYLFKIFLKSSLLQALTGEISFFDGHVRLHGSVCYVPQESCKNLVIEIIELLWIDSGIFSSTIKKNILFSNDYDQQLFERVVQATALDLVI
jgi:hypothetical protein